MADKQMPGEEMPETLEDLAYLIWYGGHSCWHSVEESIPPSPERNTRRFHLLFDFLHVFLYFSRLVAYEVVGKQEGLKLANRMDELVLDCLLSQFTFVIEDDRKVMEQDFIHGLMHSRESYEQCAVTIEQFEDLFSLFGDHAAADAGLSNDPAFTYKTKMLAMATIPTLDLYHRLAKIARKVHHSS